MKELINTVAALLNITVEEAEKNNKELPNLEAHYFWSTARGGRSVIIKANGEKLVATSSVNYEKHLQAFIDGKRN